ncbi:MAG: cob(I)alamin adenolsyltransferase [Desulfovibrio sp.]|nr:MAG: cob(I)alamin adenolsyltransferase [Desulfovibrio sp.]
MIIVYTGDGKGKTSAAVGQTIRALGRDMRVVFAQLLKRPGQAGEQAMLARMLGDDFLAGGLGFLRKEEQRPAHRKAALDTLAWAAGRFDTSRPDMLVLDEALYALNMRLIDRDDLTPFVAAAQAEPPCHLVLTGRGLPPDLAARADLITEMTPIKHPYESGVQAQEGIEF